GIPTRLEGARWLGIVDRIRRTRRIEREMRERVDMNSGPLSDSRQHTARNRPVARRRPAMLTRERLAVERGIVAKEARRASADIADPAQEFLVGQRRWCRRILYGRPL